MALSGSISGGGFSRDVRGHAPIIDRTVPGGGLGPKGVRPRVKALPGASFRNKVSVVLVATVFFGSFMVMLLSYSGPVAEEPPEGTITITGDAGFIPANGVTGGSGEPDAPWIISGWDISAGSGPGISISNTDEYFVIQDVWVHSTYEYAIYFNNANNGTVELSQIEDSDYGIYSLNSANLTFETNTFDSCLYVIAVLNSEYCRVLNNTMSAGLEAIVLSGASTCEVAGNAVSQFSLAAIYSTWSSDVLVSSNNVSDCYVTGILVQSSVDCTVYNNTLWENEGSYAGGVELYECTNALVYHNSFFRNTGTTEDQAYQSGGSGNQWNAAYMWNSPSPSGGNYWSDYSGVDDYSGATTPQTSGNPDGIGDEAHTFSENAQDNYPLMEPPSGGGTEIPEFSTVVVPVLVVMALFLFVRRHRSK